MMNEKELIHHLNRMISCLGEHLERESERININAMHMCPCLKELKLAQDYLKEVAKS